MRRILLALIACVIAAPAWPQSPAARAQLDQLLGALKAAPTEQDAAALETRITRMWIEAGSASVTLLMARGLRDAQAGAQQEAEEDFDAAIALDPNLAAAYDRRAMVRYEQGDVNGAIADLEETLKHEPRSFMALRDLTRIATERKNWRGAYEAWRRVLDLDPKTPGGGERLQDLQRRAFGEAT